MGGTGTTFSLATKIVFILIFWFLVTPPMNGKRTESSHILQHNSNGNSTEMMCRTNFFIIIMNPLYNTWMIFVLSLLLSLLFAQKRDNQP